jgi:hypothetical protein
MPLIWELIGFYWAQALNEVKQINTLYN